MAEKELKLKVVAETEVTDLEDLQSVLEETKSSADSLSESLDNVDGEGLDDSIERMEEFNDILEETYPDVEELSDNLDNIDGSGLDNAASSADELADSLSNASGSAEEVSTNLDAIEAASLLGAASEIQGYAEGAENLSQQMNTAAISVGQLATNVGMAEPQMVSLINNISNATFPQTEAMAYVNALNQMGVEAGKLGDAATNMDRINDATGIGYQKTMQLAAGLQAVGVSADNLPSSFNAIAYAQANVNGGADTLTQVLKTQAATINEYGLNVDQLVLIMQKLSERGVQGRKMGSELSKVLKECNGDTQALEQSLGLQTGALGNASAATGNYTGQLQKLADEEAEHKTWLDQINAAWEDMSLALSPIISPLSSVVGLIGQIGSFALAINSIGTLVQSLRGLSIVSSITGAVSGFINTLRTLEITTKLAAAGQALLNLVMAMNPVMLLVIAITALIAILAYLYFTNEDVRAAIDGLGQTLWGIGEIIYGSVMGALQWLNDQFQWLSSTFQGVGDTITTYAPLIGEALFVMATGGVGAILLLIANFMGMPNQIGGALQGVITKVAGFVGDLVNRFTQGARQSVSNFMNQIASLPDRFRNELNKMLSAVGEWAATLPAKFWEAGVNAVKNFLNALGIHSPGYMQLALIGEMKDTTSGIIAEGKYLVNNLGTIGTNAVKSWGNPLLTYDYMLGNNAGNNTQLDVLISKIDTLLNTINNDTAPANVTYNHYGDIDSDEKMQEILEYIRKYLYFNNDTAGRTV